MGADSKLISSSKENENVAGGVIGKRRSSSSAGGGGLSLQSKSLIPVPVASPKGTQKGDDGENVGGEVVVEQKVRRRPLGSIQNTDSPRRLSNVKEKVIIAASPKVTESTPAKKGVLRKSAKNAVATAEAGTGTTTVGGARLSTGVPNTPHNSPSKLAGKKKSGSRVGVKQVTDGEDSIAYWKALAESRRQALEDALRENMELHERVEELKKENAQLDELVEEAKELADMVNSVSEDFSLDESGIGDTISVIKAE